MRKLRQISLLSVFYFVTLCAVLVALVAPFIRAMNEERRTAFLVCGAVQWVLFVLATAWTLHKRNQIQRTSGRLIYRERAHDESLPAALGQFVKLVLVVLYEIAIARSPWILFHPFLFILQLMALDVGARTFLSLMLGVGQHFEIYERGYTLNAAKLQMWEDVKAVQPTADSADKISHRDELCDRIAKLIQAPQEHRDLI